MRVAAPAGYRAACHAKAVVYTFNNIVFRDRLPEARPAGAGFEFGARVEQHGVAADAVVQAVGVQIPGRAGKCPLGALAAGNVIGERGQLLAPLRVASDHLGYARASQAGPCRREALDQHLRSGAHWRRGVGRRRGRAGLPDQQRSDGGAACGAIAQHAAASHEIGDWLVHCAAPEADAMPHGLPPTVIRFSTCPDARSTTEISPPGPFAVYALRPSRLNATPQGRLPMSVMVLRIRPESGSISSRVAARPVVT